MTFGERLRALRQRRLLTQAELAALLGVDQRQISWWERDRALPRAKRQRQLAKALGVRRDELRGEIPARQPQQEQDSSPDQQPTSDH